MKTKTSKALDAAIDKYQTTLIKSLTKSATRSYVKGAQIASIKLESAFTQVNEEALAYAKTYGGLLAREGASWIQDTTPPYNFKKIAWLRDSTQQTRELVAKTIEEGIKAGKPVASIGGKHLADGTIARDLQNLLVREKAFENVRIARTEPARIQLEASMTQYDKNGIEEITRLCGPNPCDLCAPLCNKRFKTKAAPGILHPNGTCTNIPVIPKGGL